MAPRVCLSVTPPVRPAFANEGVESLFSLDFCLLIVLRVFRKKIALGKPRLTRYRPKQKRKTEAQNRHIDTNMAITRPWPTWRKSPDLSNIG